MRTGFPARVSSYRLASKTKCPNCTLSDDISNAPRLAPFYGFGRHFRSGVLQAIYRRSPLCPAAFGRKIPQHLGGANAPSKKNLEAP